MGLNLTPMAHDVPDLDLFRPVPTAKLALWARRGRMDPHDVFTSTDQIDTIGNCIFFPQVADDQQTISNNRVNVQYMKKQ